MAKLPWTCEWAQGHVQNTSEMVQKGQKPSEWKLSCCSPPLRSDQSQHAAVKQALALTPAHTMVSLAAHSHVWLGVESPVLPSPLLCLMWSSLLQGKDCTGINSSGGGRKRGRRDLSFFSPLCPHSVRGLQVLRHLCCQTDSSVHCPLFSPSIRFYFQPTSQPSLHLLLSSQARHLTVRYTYPSLHAQFTTATESCFRSSGCMLTSLGSPCYRVAQLL